MKTLHFQSTIVESEKINPLFTKVKIHVAYDGENRNGSFISRETFDNASPSAMYCPIIGEWSEPVEDFQGHGGKLEIKDNSIEFVNTTVAYGCISNEEPTWETVVDENGDSRDYFTLQGFIWTSRFPELESLIDNQKSHSMEIEIIDGKYQTIDGKKLYAINDMVFSGFCILGDDVEPCFENSTISSYSLDKDKFKQEFKQMMNELKFSLEHVENKNNSVQEGGKKMEELQLLLDKYSLTFEDLTSKEINHEDFSLEELEVKIQEIFKQEEPAKEEFTLTSEQLENELTRELAEIEMIQDEYWEDYSYPRFNFVDYMPEQMVVVAYDCKEGMLVGFNYQLINENVEVDADSAVRYKVEFVPMNLVGDPDDDSDVFSKHFTSHSQVERKLKVKEDELNKKFQSEKETAQVTLDKAYADFARLQEDYSKLEESTKELEQFKLNALQSEREEAENELFTKFANSGLTEEDMSSIKEKKDNFSIEELEEKLFAIAGRKKLVFSKSPEQKPIRYNLPVDNKKSSDKDWADLVEQHKNK